MKFKIGVLGSCPTRDIFRTYYNETYYNDFNVVFQQQRKTLISLMQKPSQDDLDFQENIYSEWVYEDLSKSLFDELKKGIDYLVIDMFFDAYFGVIIYDDLIITNDKWDSFFTNFDSKIENKEILTMFSNHDKYFELWKENCDKFFEYMKKEFPKTKIVLNKIRGAKKAVAQDGSSYIPNSYLKKTKQLNIALEELEQYIIDNYDIIVIDCLKYAIADDGNIRGEYFINFIEDYYTFAYAQIKDTMVQDKLDSFEDLNKKYEDLNKKYKKLKEEKISSNTYDPSNFQKFGFSKVSIPSDYILKKRSPNGVLFTNGKTSIAIHEVPKFNSYDILLKKWNERFVDVETDTYSLNNITFKSATVKFNQDTMRETYFKKNEIDYHIYERGVLDKNAFDTLVNSVTLDFDYSLLSKLREIPQLSYTSFGYSTNDGKIKYHNWIQAFFKSTIMEDLNDFCEKQWFTRYLNDKFPNENYKLNFFGPFGLHHTLRDPMQGKKVFFTIENLNYRFFDMKRNYGTYALDYVDLSMGYDLINHENYFRFPYWACAHFSPEVTEEEIENTLDNWMEASYEKTNDVTNVCRHDRWNTRKKICDDVEKIVEIEYGGVWRNNTDKLHITYNNNKTEYLKQFKFNICPENLNDHGYVTEKIFDAIKSDCIPLYLGGGDYLEPKMLNQDAILRWFMEDTNDDTIELFKNIYSDEKTYKEFKDQNILLDSSKKYVIKMFSDLEKHFERLIYD